MKNMTGFCFCLRSTLSGFCLLGSISSVSAHEIVQEYAFGEKGRQSFLGLETTYGAFEFGGWEGHYLTNALRGEYLIREDLAFGARLPVHLLWREGTQTRSGVGDVDLWLRYRVYQNDDGYKLFVGGSGEVPIGSESRGISSGHGEISPFITGQVGNDKTLYYATLAAVFALSGRHAGDYTFNFVSPHADHELQYNFGGLYSFTDTYYVSLGFGGFTALKNDPYFGGSTWFVSPSVAWTPAEDWRLIVSPEIPFGPHQRFSWKGTLNFDYLF